MYVRHKFTISFYTFLSHIFSYFSTLYIFFLRQEILVPLDPEYSVLAKEAFEVLTITLALCPNVLENLIRERSWHLFIIDTLLLCNNR